TMTIQQFSKSNTHRVFDGTISTDGHDRLVILKLRPLDSAPFNHAELNARLEWNLDRRPGNFTIAHRGMSITDVEKSSLHVHWKVHRVAHASFWRIHVPAELRRHDRTARLAIRRSHTRSEERRVGKGVRTRRTAQPT